MDGPAEPHAVVPDVIERTGHEARGGRARRVAVPVGAARTPSAEERLRLSTVAFLELLASIGDMERQKQALPAGDPGRVRLTDRMDGVMVELLLRSQREARLLAEAAGPPSRPPRPAHIALTDWEEAERQLRDAVRVLRRLAITTDGYEAHEPRPATDGRSRSARRRPRCDGPDTPM